MNLRPGQHPKGNAYGHQVARRTHPTPQEVIVSEILRRNKSFYEFQPVVFAANLHFHISPDFLVYSWRGKCLGQPHYVEIDGDSKYLQSRYQIRRVEGMRYPLIRIWNRDIKMAEQILNDVLSTQIPP